MGRHPDATIDALALNAIGHVPWWPPDQNEVSLHHVRVRVATDTSRHAGQADIIRELIVGTVGLTKESAPGAPLRRVPQSVTPGSTVMTLSSRGVRVHARVARDDNALVNHLQWHRERELPPVAEDGPSALSRPAPV